MEKQNKCYNCSKFSRYYVKGVKQFNKVNLGWCSLKTNTVDANNTCDNYCIRPRLPRHRELLCYHINDLLTEISEIRQILEEEDKEFRQLEEL